MKQYNTIKAKYPDALLLFRVGDFYETFSEDAIRTANILGIVLTRRANGSGSHIELAGFPYHSLDTYLPKLVRAGHRVAICDQLEDPKATKTIVKRGVTELISPGVAYSDKILDHKFNNFLACIHFTPKGLWGIAFLDISTGEFLISEGDPGYIDKLVQSFKPAEVIFQKDKKKLLAESFPTLGYTHSLEEWVFGEDYCREKLLKHFDIKSLKGFGIEELPSGIVAAGAILHYLSENQIEKLSHISSLSRIDPDQYVWLDRFTVRNLELISSPNEQATTLIDILDHTFSPMGSRLMKRWLILPLKNLQKIQERLDTVEHLIKAEGLAEVLSQQITQIGDLERLISKVALGKVNPREVLQLERALKAVGMVLEICKDSDHPALKRVAERLNPCLSIKNRIEKEIHPDAPVLLSKGKVMADGVSADLDELRAISYSGKDYLLKVQQREIERTQIPSLKIAFNSVFGYYLEVTNTHKDKVPSDWVRKQTLVNAERYITEELKQYEEKILGAEEKIQAIENVLFADLVMALTEFVQPIQYNAQLIAELDCLLSFAHVSKAYNYCKPELNDGEVTHILGGRHPVIERKLPIGEEFIANDVLLDPSAQQILMITGPNMAGKSALLRQTALISIIAQMGCFVPATKAKMGWVDKIFTRVGASDNISLGESTFMVEMNETASILNNLSSRSLVLLDEIGRGTSTYDGISIAWAIAEYLHEHESRPKTLFATHYHELNDMTELFKRIKNFNVSVKEIDNRIIFLRRLQPGGSEHSFGIHVAKMAGMPKKVLSRANEVLSQLEKSHSGESLKSTTRASVYENMQMSFFQLDDPLLEEIRETILNIDVNTLTPVEALFKLNEIKKKISRE